ncbi:YchJ family protein [Legionella taurinensis]|uniref:YchJ-like middle NTF2-like domain-containing protein n=1 Tax=Legionella taurinensis TaxID=70611 RepID=A0A3A5L547_9GAMM|nr:YchJ family metal-binding protein [Legionella taurinensis]RJT47928.1 hypothetical protein D6J04_04980 [Legionella taurinensis]RJT68142.1 hypothetical protein D6J03_05105 [Legionella taurinensis]STY25684.1 putative SEC-C motif domain protein [Legionella taurinensis]
MADCPCGSLKDYKQCCGLYLEQSQRPPTPEALMRSRYTAYTQANMTYIKNTMKGEPLLGFHEHEVAQWAAKVDWLGLQVVNCTLDSDNPDRGYVEFLASLRDGGKLQAIHERSEFIRAEGQWFYTAAHKPLYAKPQHKRAISRNAPCPCGSQKKYKNCHALSERQRH